MYAAIEGHEAVIKELILRGADIYAKGPANASPLDYIQMSLSELKLNDSLLYWIREREREKRRSKGHCPMCGQPFGFFDRESSQA